MGERKHPVSSATESNGAADPEGIAVTLREARERLGVELRDVASMLRIRFVYLQAIEDGRFDELPGTAYATGFLRSYSEFLGLDPEMILRRYKDEAAGRVGRKQEFYLPTPVAEGRALGGTMLLATLVLAGSVYGAWYYLSATDRSVADMVPVLPDRLVSLLDNLPWTSSSQPAQTAAAPEAPATPPTTPVVTVAPPATIAAAPAAPPAQGGTSAPPPPSAAPRPVTPPTAAPRAEEDEADMATQEPTPLSPTAAAPPAAPPPAPVQADGNGKVYGAQTGTVRVQVRAVQDSWVQVRDSQEIIFTRVLKAGDTYRVPERPGVRLRTGNAGGLVLVTDGVAGQPMGSVGQVLRDVPLDGSAKTAR